MGKINKQYLAFWSPDFFDKIAWRIKAQYRLDIRYGNPGYNNYNVIKWDRNRYICYSIHQFIGSWYFANKPIIF